MNSNMKKKILIANINNFKILILLTKYEKINLISQII